MPDRLNVPVQFGYGQCRCFPNIRANVRGAFFDGKDDDATNHRHSNARQDTEGHGADKWIGVREVLLESVDRQQGEIGLLLCITQDIDVDQLADFEVVRCNVLDYLCEELGYISTFGNELGV